MKFKVFSFIIAFLCFSNIYAADISISGFELENTTGFDSNNSKLQSVTQGFISGRFIPSSLLYFHGQVDFISPNTFYFFSTDYDSQIPAEVRFKSLSLNFPSLFNKDFSLSLFAGNYDDLASGKFLKTSLKYSINEPDFIGISNLTKIENKSSVNGLGISWCFRANEMPIAFNFNSYWNSKVGELANLTQDVKVVYASDFFRLNFYSGLYHQLFLGSTYFKSGLTTLAVPNENFELYSSFGFDNFSFSEENSLAENFSFIFEARLKSKIFFFNVSYFSIPTEGKHEFLSGFNSTVGLGNIEINKMRGGVSFYSIINDENANSFTPFSINLSPFYSLILGDTLFDFVAVVKPMEFQNIFSMIELQFKIKAVY